MRLLAQQPCMRAVVPAQHQTYPQVRVHVELQEIDLCRRVGLHKRELEGADHRGVQAGRPGRASRQGGMLHGVQAARSFLLTSIQSVA